MLFYFLKGNYNNPLGILSPHAVLCMRTGVYTENTCKKLGFDV